ncbi:hypothetical protein KC316_g1614 [Hortaea werneckii]|nr:hypothetical protein KC324_g1524 [Hortaea werneckii]KAI7593631.1 hypothetical protein KC316_g1614 [Hortaea werneckii]
MEEQKGDENALRRRMQNREAQRRFREKAKVHNSTAKSHRTVTTVSAPDDRQESSHPRESSSSSSTHERSNALSLEFGLDKAPPATLDPLAALPPDANYASSPSPVAGGVWNNWLIGPPDTHGIATPVMDPPDETFSAAANPTPSVPQRSGWQNPLHMAAKKGNEQIVRTLLRHTGDSNARDSDGMTALMYAAANGHKAVVSCLLSHDACVGTVDNQGHSPLHLAVQNRQVSTLETLLGHCGGGVSLLLELGANVHYLAGK